MSRIIQNLLPDEEMIFFTRQHPIVFFPAVLWFVLALAILIVLPAVQPLAWLALAGGIFTSGYRYIGYCYAEFAVTNQRVIMHTGFFNRHSLELSLDKIESLQIYQSIVGSSVGFGTLLIIGTGGTRDAFHLVHDPYRLRGQIQAQIETYKKRK